MGKTCLRSVIDHPDLDLVGLYVHDERKAGADAGEIARRPLTGVQATRSIDEILAIDADIVLHCPLLQFPYDAHDDDVCRLLESGKNVISINNYFHPQSLGADYAARLEESCKRGHSTLAGTGINPGMIAERLAVVASGLILELDSIACREVYDCIDMPNPDYVFGILGMGSPPEKVDLADGPLARMFTDMFRQCVGALGARLDIPLTAIEPAHEVVAAPQDIRARAGTIKAGTVAATKWQVHGLVNSRRVITHSVSWVMGRGLPGYEEFRHWHLELRGKPGLDIHMDLVEPENTGVKTAAVQYGVAAMVTQAIAHVIAAPPGLWEVSSAPHYRTRLHPIDASKY
ncbi:MAG: dihydrodipicolinate reductase [Gammaproteobacteria bacterium]|nr:dihydrodipicolinate reductase [Gammaproteobacteria bacterium]